MFWALNLLNAGSRQAGRFVTVPTSSPHQTPSLPTLFWSLLPLLNHRSIACVNIFRIFWCTIFFFRKGLYEWKKSQNSRQTSLPRSMNATSPNGKNCEQIGYHRWLPSIPCVCKYFFEDSDAQKTKLISVFACEKEIVLLKTSLLPSICTHARDFAQGV
jgi:hypothetical protein